MQSVSFLRRHDDAFAKNKIRQRASPITTPLFSLSIQRDNDDDDETRRRRDQEDDSVCDTDPAVIFEDDEEGLTLYDAKFEPTCTCSEENSLNDFLKTDPFPDANTTSAVMVREFLEEINAAASDVSFQREVNCANGCSMCFDEFCGVLSTTEATSFKGGYTSNFTVTDLIAIGSEENETVVEETLLARLALSVGSFQEKTCFDALEGASGEICFATDFSFESDTGVGLDDFEVVFRTQGEASCSVTVNGDECKSCEFDLALGCTLMDCTNLLKNTMLNTCTGSREEFPGVFGAMYVIQAEVESTNFTLGTCDLTDARTSAPTSSSGGFGRFLFAGAATSVLLVLVGM